MKIQNLLVNNAYINAKPALKINSIALVVLKQKIETK